MLAPAELARLGNLELVARTVVEGFLAGLHRSTQRGHSVEFAQHRAYTPGEEPRHIDWRLWARTDRLYARQFHEPTEARVYLLLDASASMGYGSGPLSKLDYARYLAAAMAGLAVRQSDRVALALFDEHPRCFLPARTGTAHLRRIWLTLQAAEAGHATRLTPSLGALAGRLHRRGLIVVVSDLLTELDDAVNALACLRRKPHEVIVFHVLDPAELSFPFDSAVTLLDPESRRAVPGEPGRLRRQYLQRLQRWLADCRARLLRQNIEYARFDTSVPFDAALQTYLATRQRVR